jgi:2-polyprenyl-3-methyl-5-hydroxy-6-metoxy-1,4-benzoquinol methylase
VNHNPLTMPCPVCQNTQTELFANVKDIEYQTSESIYQYLKCNSCESIYLENPPVDQLNQIYPQSYYSYSENNSNSMIQKIKQHLDTILFSNILKKVQTTPIKILDIGGGTGWLLNSIKSNSKMKLETHVLDIDENGKKMAEKNGHIFHLTPIEAFSTENKFDLIIMLNLIEHVADPKQVMQKAKTLLAPGGFLVIKTPNTQALDCKLFRHQNWAGFHCPRHWVLFNRRNFAKLSEDTQFICHKIKYTQGAPFWTYSILGILQKWNLIKNTPQNLIVRHPLSMPLLLLTAMFDYLRMPFFPTSQMLFILRHNDSGS